MYLEQRFPDRQVGSNAEPFSVQLVRFGVPIDLTGATITFRMVSVPAGDVKVDAPGTGASNGVAQYAPTPSDVDTAGDYACQMIATFVGGGVHKSEAIALRLVRNP